MIRNVWYSCANECKATTRVDVKEQLRKNYIFFGWRVLLNQTACSLVTNGCRQYTSNAIKSGCVSFIHTAAPTSVHRERTCKGFLRQSRGVQPWNKSLSRSIARNTRRRVAPTKKTEALYPSFSPLPPFPNMLARTQPVPRRFSFFFDDPKPIRSRGS